MAGGTQRVEWQTTNNGRYTSTLRFGPAPPQNNPGQRIMSQMRIEFGSHLEVTNLTLDLRSTNTAGNAWEFTVMAFLQPDGSYFTAAPVISPYLNHTSFNGSPSQGWFAADSTQTVTDVGTNQTSSGVSGTFNNMTLTYALAGLMPGTPIGGVDLLFFLENVRGVDNGPSEFGGSLIALQMEGMTRNLVAVPEAGTGWLVAMAAAIAMVFRRRRRP